MAGITDWPFRLLCKRMGCDVFTTEMVSAQGYLCTPKHNRANRDLVVRAPYEGTLLVQIFGHEPRYMADAAKELTQLGRFCGVDINMGCPARKITGSGSGSALMRDERLAAQVIRAVVGATLLPVSVKMRLGWDEETVNAVRIAHIAQEEGAAFVTVHGRTRAQQYAGQANVEEIARVKQAVRIPVIANGDVRDGASAKETLQITGADGLAVGRAALGNPWVFANIKAALRGESFCPPTAQEIVHTAQQHARYMCAFKGEKWALLEMRKHIAWYMHGKRGASALRTRLNTAQSFDAVFALLDEFAALNPS